MDQHGDGVPPMSGRHDLPAIVAGVVVMLLALLLGLGAAGVVSLSAGGVWAAVSAAAGAGLLAFGLGRRGRRP